MLRIALVAVSVLVSTAHAQEIATDGPPPPPAAIAQPEVAKPADPPQMSVGFRFGVATIALPGDDRVALVAEIPWSISLHRRVRALVEYQFLELLPGSMEASTYSGRGHALRAGARVLAAEKRVRDEGRFYADVQATGGIAFVRDGADRSRMSQATTTARLGIEMWFRDKSWGIDGYLLGGALFSDGDPGMLFASALEFTF